MGGTPAPDEIVAGKYRLTTMLGQGGMGSVWEGIHTSLGTRVAIKLIENDYIESEEARQRFVNEAQAAARLRSKHVVQVFDQGVMADGRPYIVMEFLPGEPLDKRLDRVGRLSLQQTAVIIAQVCRALTKAHDVGIVHRDMKPENIFLVHDEEDGTEIAKVVDFGIAKFTDRSLGVSNSTRTGSVLGTPYYMSPEQARGLRSVDPRGELDFVAVNNFATTQTISGSINPPPPGSPPIPVDCSLDISAKSRGVRLGGGVNIPLSRSFQLSPMVMGTIATITDVTISDCGPFRDSSFEIPKDNRATHMTLFIGAGIDWLLGSDIPSK